MIKTDQQLRRTLEAIDGFEASLQAAKGLEDSAERELVTASYQGMISNLDREIERYEKAKKGIVHVPRSIRSLSDLCPVITDIRIALGWTQESLALQLGLTRQRINQMEEHEYRSIDISQLQQILEKLGVETETTLRHNTICLKPSQPNVPEPAVA